MVAARDGLTESDALGARADRVGGVLDVGAVDIDAAAAAAVVAALARERRRADPEPAVGAVRGRLGGDAAPV